MGEKESQEEREGALGGAAPASEEGKEPAREPDGAGEESAPKADGPDGGMSQDSPEDKEGQEAQGEEAAKGEPQEIGGEAGPAEEEGQRKPGKRKGKREARKEEEQEQKIAELTDKLMRTMAEFDNFRKRSEKEKAQMFEVGAKSILEKILPVIDNFERGLASVPEEEKGSPFVQGMEQVYRQLLTSLESVGVKQIDALGKEFDPNFHNAVMHAEDENMGENIVAEELQKGYLYRDTVVRHSMVKVVN